MHIQMTTEQAKQLADFIRHARSLKERELERDYTWREMAGDLGMAEETLRKIKNAKGGISTPTIALLVQAFGPIILDLLGIPRDAKPTFKVKGLADYRPGE